MADVNASGGLPELDVVIPVRTVDRYLGETLDSVFAQTGVSCRVFVVDGGSETPIRLPVEHASRPNLRLVRSEEPLTAGGGRNVGARLGTAPWLSFVDADDRWPQHSRAELIDACLAESADLAVGTVIHFSSDEESQTLDRPAGKRKALLAGGVLMPRSTWDRVGEFDPGLRAGEFVEWVNRLSGAGLTTVAIESVVLERRVHLASTTASQLRADSRDDYLEVVRRWMNRTS